MRLASDNVLDLLLDEQVGICHLASDGCLSWADFARRLANAADLDPDMIEPVKAETLGWRARRPTDAALATGRGQLLPGIDDAIARFIRDYPADGSIAGQ